MKRIKKKPNKDKEGRWDTSDLYRCSRSLFEIEWLKHFNKMEGRDQIIFLYKDRGNKKIIKYRTLR